ncbi:membrane assembly protein AsmA [[Pantoea] beijingensis]|uniref:Membrane assembly protein AsmA n=1 Tax=[Pantoea] beijingensis TaxID=1324864 RepID=A0A443IAQ6_9GAMM|nr:outer membrane assembly protein AsmA [[Pantoea] beijingensis]RWR01179.1 membrane assembly protein AsmA [[Pantoea] beijingensis]
MRRVITTLVILLVVIVAGMTALVLLVNPNDFRSYMVQKVEQRSGYKLALEGNLRWHVWPQLSILAGRMSITAPGAQQPMVKADNMRLDVKLLPLFSHQLSVKQVMLKNAVIRVTPDSEAQRPQDAPVGPADSTVPEAVSGWKFDIANLRVADSLLIWQQAGGEQINFRDINLEMAQNEHKQANIELSTRVNRDQRELQLALKGDMDVAEYPHRLSGKIDALSYELNGADLPAQGLKGNATLMAEWQNDARRFSLKEIVLSTNESQLQGTVSGTLGDMPDISVDLHSPKLDLDALLGMASGAEQQDGQAVQAQRSGRGPVIAQLTENSNANSPLNTLRATLMLRVDDLLWRGMNLNNVQLTADNDRGLMNVTTFKGQSGSGDFSIPGSINIRSAQTKVAIKPVLNNIELSPLLKAFEIPETVSGTLSLTGDMHGNGLNVHDFKRHWLGSAELNMENARLAGLNFQQMIQQAVERSNSQVRGTQSEASYTEVQHLKGQIQLNNGSMALVNLQGRSSLLDLAGQGSVDLDNKQCDITFNIKVIDGWQGNSALIQTLTETAIPLRLYGPWDGLRYSLQVDQILRKRIQDEAKARLNQWVEHKQDKRKADDVKK